MKKGYVGDGVRAKLKKLAAYVKKYREKHGYSPCLREMADEFGTSTSVIRFYIRRLLSAGMATYDNGIARSLVIKEN